MAHKIIFCYLLFIVYSFSPAYSQTDKENISTDHSINATTKKNLTYPTKGKMYFLWGYNRSAYTNSDIHLKGDNYNFTIENVRASDAPTTTLMTYINPSTMSIPQYDWRVGYFLTDKYSVSFGHAHMKYEIENQYVGMTGEIYGGELAGLYDNTPVKVGEGVNNEEHEGNEHKHDASNELPEGIVSKLEHCDGLNNFTFEFARRDNFWVSSNRKHCLSFEVAIGLGASVTDTEASVLGVSDPNHGEEHGHEEGADEHGGSWGGFHLAGYTTSVSTSIQMEFFNHFFIQTRLTGGFVNLTDFITTHEGGRGSQKLGFIEGIVSIGYTFQLTK